MRTSLSAEQVKRELKPNQSEAVLKELHLISRDGKLNADSLRKLKQINHFANFLAPIFDDLFARFQEPLIFDAGSGNAYLGFILYELFFKTHNKGFLENIDSREELIEQGKERAQRLHFDRMRFQTATLQKAIYPEKMHLMIALHACDIATDDALFSAITKNADYIAVVPCCQAEVAQLLKDSKNEADPVFQTVYDHPWHRREFGSHVTNVIRALTLESYGYQVTVTELTGWEHSLKNELILAKKLHQKNGKSKQKLDALLASLKITPTLIRRLNHFERKATET